MSKLHTYIGIEEGKVCVFVSPWLLNKLSPMHLRGDPLPKRVTDFIESGEGDAAEVLKQLEEYYKPKRRKNGTK